MLIKLACNYEINPDSITLEHRGDTTVAHVDGLVLPLTQEELAKIRTYHTKTVVVKADSHISDDRLISMGINPFVPLGMTASEVFLDDQPKKIAKPFTIQGLPKVSDHGKGFFSNWGDQFKLIKERTDPICAMCVKKNSRDCGVCFDFSTDSVTLRNFEAKESALEDFTKKFELANPDCSGGQHAMQEEKRCAICSHGNKSISEWPCRDCWPDTKHWTPRI